MEDYFSSLFPDDEQFIPLVEHASTIPSDDLYIARVEATFGLPITELLTYGADLQELVEYIITPKTVCEFSYELQSCIFDIFPRWYIAQTPLRGDIYPDYHSNGTTRGLRKQNPGQTTGG